MKKLAALVLVALLLGFAASAHAMEGMDHGKMDDKGSMETFKHSVKVEGVLAEFQVMSLASMNMKDDSGATHHVMVTLHDTASGEQIKNAVGRVKVIPPEGKDQVVDLKDYSGILAANFMAMKKGKYGIICLFKVGDKKRTAKFWWDYK